MLDGLQEKLMAETDPAMIEAVRGVCFMVTPFGVKPTGITDAKIPTSIDFNALWVRALYPAIANAGYLPVRAGQDLGPSILKDMLERLALADLVIADLSINNVNAYYEIGVRHAVPNRDHSVLIAADWAVVPFDLNQVRQVRYPLPSGELTDAHYDAIRTSVEGALGKQHERRGPLRELVAGYPEPDRVRATTFKQTVEVLARFEREIQSLRIAPKAERIVQLRALRARYEPQLSNPGATLASVGQELLLAIRDVVDPPWQEIVDFAAKLPRPVRESAVVVEQTQLALSKLGRHADAIAALTQLIKTHGDTPERRGLIGGSYKRLRRTAQDEADKARYLNGAIEHYESGMWLDLNQYFCSSNLPRLYRTRRAEGDDEHARVTAELVVQACQRAKRRGTGDEWLNPTLLVAAFDTGNVARAKELLTVVRLEGHATWKLGTTLDDLKVSASQQPDASVRRALEMLIAELEALLER